MKNLIAGLSAAACFMAAPLSADTLSLAYFMGPKHPMNAAVFTPFAEKLAEVSGGELTVQQFPGGALNSVPPKQYAILLDGVADIVFTLPGYTGDVFPMTQVVGLPDVCSSATACTEALLNARETLETEYNAKVLAIWANAPPVLLTRDKPVRSLEDLEGMTLRVTNKADVPFAEALGASAVTQPVSVINQNLSNGVIDGIVIDPSAIRSFKLNEPANYVTTWFPASGSAFVLLMNQDVYDGLSDEAKGWVDAASDASLSVGGGAAYQAAAGGGIELARETGVEVIELSAEEQARWKETIAPALAATMDEKVGDLTVRAVMDLMQGK
ncbi:MAG: TRAP transporter substrate-binding protein [Pseudomonadota bacterium]